MLTAGTVGRRWLIMLLLGVGVTAAGWFALSGPTRPADAQTAVTLTPSSMSWTQSLSDTTEWFGMGTLPSLETQTPVAEDNQITWKWSFTFNVQDNYEDIDIFDRFAYRVYPSSESPELRDNWVLTSPIDKDPLSPDAVTEFMVPGGDATFPRPAVNFEIVTDSLTAGTEYTFEITPAFMFMPDIFTDRWAILAEVFTDTAMATTGTASSSSSSSSTSSSTTSSSTTVATTTEPTVPGRQVPGGDGVADHLAVYSACPGIDPNGSDFTDVAGSFALAEIACISHFGITQGRTATMFAPAETVSRWQMALFLFRAAGPAGVELADPAPDQGFTDIGGLSPEAQQAANALAQANIMPGISDTEFLPNDLMSRASTAVLLDAFLAQAAIGSGGTDPDDVRPNDNVFTDLEEVTTDTYDAVRRAYELGITRGVTATRFGPDEMVTREQMAALVVRMLAHTQTKPAGISVQHGVGVSPVAGDDLLLLVSVRDATFQPVVDAHADLFYYTDTNADEAFADNGACSTSQVSPAGEGLDVCEIDSSDPLTDDNGDVEETLTPVPNETTTVIAWTGDDGDAFDNDTTDRATLRLNTSKGATQLIVSDNLAETQQKIRFGDTFQLTFQLSDEDDNPVAISGEHINLRVEETGDSTFRATTTYRTDSAGQVSLAFTQTNRRNSNADATVSVTIQAWPSSYTLVDETTNNCPSNACTATWSDENPAPTTLRFTQPRQYTFASDQGRGAVNQVMATLTNQYGEPMRGEQVSFEADSASTAQTRHTDRRGQAAFVYNRDATTSMIETITATHVPSTGETTPATVIPPDGLTHYWVIAPTADEIPATGRAVLLGDTANNRIVYQHGTEDSHDVRIVEYDSNDQRRNADGPISLASFESTISNPSNNLQITITRYSQNSDEVSSFTITTDS